MIRRPLILVVLVALALPLSASQFINVAFDDMARGSELVVRGTIEETYSKWDDANEVIYTYATIRVKNYFADTTGPDYIVVREVGGTVGGYTQQAIGFPELRRGEDVVLFLSRWEEDAADLRIDAFSQGKYLVKNRGGQEVLMLDAMTQGADRDERTRGFRPEANAAMDVDAPGLTMDEFRGMVEAARNGGRSDDVRRQK